MVETAEPVVFPQDVFGTWRRPSAVRAGRLSDEQAQSLLRPHEIGSLLGGVFPDPTFLRVWYDGEKQPDGTLLKPWSQAGREGYVVDLQQAYDALAGKNATFLIRFADSRHSALNAATQHLKRLTGYDVICHVFVSAGGSRGVQPHVDAIPVVWVQVAGEKDLMRWNDLPDAALEEQSIAHPQGEPHITRLRSGDWNIGTAKMVHAARTPSVDEGGSGFSVHVVFMPWVLTLGSVVKAALCERFPELGNQLAQHRALAINLPPRPSKGRECDGMKFLLDLAVQRLRAAGDVEHDQLACVQDVAEDVAGLTGFVDKVYGLPPEPDVQIHTALGLPPVTDVRLQTAQDAATNLV